jgi:hypothetical protein
MGVGVRAEGLTDVGDRRWPAAVATAARGDGEGAVLLGNTRTREVH